MYIYIYKFFPHRVWIKSESDTFDRECRKHLMLCCCWSLLVTHSTIPLPVPIKDYSTHIIYGCNNCNTSVTYNYKYSIVTNASVTDTFPVSNLWAPSMNCSDLPSLVDTFFRFLLKPWNVSNGSCIVVPLFKKIEPPGSV